MQRYDSYKDSGVKWLGEIPSHWEIVKIKNICFPLKSGGTPQSGHDEFYSDEGTPWVAIGDMSNVDYLYKTMKCVTKKGINNKKLTVYPKGTLLYSIYATLGKVCTLCVPATINQAILAINVRNESYYQPYLKYYLKCIEPNLPSYSNSNTQSNLNAEIVNNLRVLSCPISEQKHIVSYLDSATSKIDEAIAQQQKMIDLLNERKQIIINNAVTKGLDPNVKMKPSGIDWIGDIPEHWIIVPMKYCMKIKNGMDYKHIEAESGIPVIGSGGQFAYASDFIYDGEVVFFGRKGTVDKPLYFKGKFWAVDTMFYAIPLNNITGRYLYYQGLIIPYKYYATSTALPSMTQTDLGNNPICLPSLGEQNAIVEYLDAEIGKIDEIRNAFVKQIALLQERKQIIINDVVTGKVKVI